MVALDQISAISENIYIGKFIYLQLYHFRLITIPICVSFNFDFFVASQATMCHGGIENNRYHTGSGLSGDYLIQFYCHKKI